MSTQPKTFIDYYRAIGWRRQEDAAAELGLSQPWISRLLAGDTPSRTVMHLCARIYTERQAKSPEPARAA